MPTYFKDVFLEKLSLVEAKRRQAITWKYLQNHQDAIRQKGVRSLFEMCTLIEGPYEGYPALTARVLLDLMEEETDVQNSISDDLKKINAEIGEINAVNRCQDVMFELIDKSNLHQKIKVTLCDQIQSNYPGYNKALIHKASILWGNKEQPEGRIRFNEAMGVLIQLLNDSDAKAFRKDFIQQRWDYIAMNDPLPKQLEDFDPKNETDLNLVNYIIKEKEKN